MAIPNLKDNIQTTLDKFDVGEFVGVTEVDDYLGELSGVVDKIGTAFDDVKDIGEKVTETSKQAFDKISSIKDTIDDKVTGGISNAVSKVEDSVDAIRSAVGNTDAGLKAIKDRANLDKIKNTVSAEVSRWVSEFNMTDVDVNNVTADSIKMISKLKDVNLSDTEDMVKDMLSGVTGTDKMKGVVIAATIVDKMRKGNTEAYTDVLKTVQGDSAEDKEVKVPLPKYLDKYGLRTKEVTDWILNEEDIEEAKDDNKKSEEKREEISDLIKDLNPFIVDEIDPKDALPCLKDMCKCKQFAKKGGSGCKKTMSTCCKKMDESSASMVSVDKKNDIFSVLDEMADRMGTVDEFYELLKELDVPNLKDILAAADKNSRNIEMDPTKSPVLDDALVDALKHMIPNSDVTDDTDALINKIMNDD